LPLEDLDPQLLNIRGITFRSALIHLEIVPADRFRRGQRASGCLTRPMRCSCFAVPRRSPCRLRPRERFLNPLSRSRISQGYTPRFTVF
jgi:hypothetical protein